MRVGLLGTGWMGTVHARQYAKMPDVELHVFDRRPERVAAFCSEWNATPASDCEALLDTADVVDICYPTDRHADYALRAIAAGKPVIVEKPLALDVADSMKIVEAADRAGVPLGCAMVVRCFPEYAAAHQLVQSGALGRPAAARTRRGGKAPLTGADNWFMDHRRSGGVLVDLAIHDFDWLRWTFGEVAQLYSRSVRAEAGEGPDYALTTLTFDSGLVAHCESTWMDPSGFRTTFEVCGSEGMIEYDSRTTPSLRTHTASGSVAESPVAATDDPYYLELRAFLDAVSAGTPPPISGLEGAKAVALGVAALESARTGQPVKPARL